MITVALIGFGLLIVIAAVVGIMDAAQASAWRRVAEARRRAAESRRGALHSAEFRSAESSSTEWDDD